MDRHDDHLPEDLRDVAGRLRESRAQLTPLELDQLRSRVHRRVDRGAAPRRSRFVAILRMNLVAAALTVGLVLTSGVGAVIASQSLGGGTNTFSATNFNHPTNSAGCQYHGPYTWTFTFQSKHHSTLTITLTWDCRKLTYDFECAKGITSYQFDSTPAVWPRSTSASGTAPTGLSSTTVTFDGTTVTLPIVGF
jgi:hypothetical protein